MAEREQSSPASDQSALDELKSLLIGPEQQELSQLRERIVDPELRAEDMAKVLAEAIKLTRTEGEGLTQALEEPISETIKKSARENPEVFADAFYPVISPAIRKSISAALKEMVESLNQALDHSFTLKGLRWRMESIRSGIPFAEVALRHTLAYRVEQVLLIQPESGLLIEQVSAPLSGGSDPDAVSAMLTAIGDFVRTAFAAGDSDQSLDTVDMGEYTLLLFHGPKAYLACAVRGIAPAKLSDHCHETLEKIHRRYGEHLDLFDGSQERTKPLVPLLESCLVSEQKSEEKRSGFSTPFIIFLLLLITVIGWFSYRSYIEHQEHLALQGKFDTLIQQFEMEPGIFVSKVEKADKKIAIRGLRDAFSTPPAELINDIGLTEEQVDISLLEYQDNSPAFVRKRLPGWLSPPATVEMKLSDRGVLTISGSASREWIQHANTVAAVTPGISDIDSSDFLDSDQLLLKKVETLLPPEPETTLSVKDAVLHARGIASVAWIENLEKLPDSLPLLLAPHRLIPREVQELEQARKNLNALTIQFSEEVTLKGDQESFIDAAASAIKTIWTLSDKLSLIARVHIIGHTDGIGIASYNHMLASARAGVIFDLLVERGLPPELFRLEESIPPSPSAWENSEMRRASFRLELIPQSSRERDNNAGQ